MSSPSHQAKERRPRERLLKTKSLVVFKSEGERTVFLFYSEERFSKSLRFLCVINGDFLVLAYLGDTFDRPSL